MKATKTELLAPAGSPAALDAALESGADAIYLGATAFNARMNAKNFTREDLRAGIRRAHALGASIYLTLNTQIYDKELSAYLDAAREAYDDGVDALIIADLGAARAVHRALPDFPLHASTQMSAHNTDMGRFLSEYGYTRVVLARETSGEDIRAFCENAPVEAEVFLHGALCVSHSGQCLFSSVVGGRSGNRGECAQPCRLPYNGGYPLSLKDLCLARQIPELCRMGVASLKIEGRMKSPEYVREVVRIYRRLIDEGRGASDEEIAELSAVFSRGGFTDGYYTRRIGKEMLGVRSESDKETSRTLSPFTGLTRKVPVDFAFSAKTGEPISLTLTSGNDSVTVTGEAPVAAEDHKTDEGLILRQLSMLGGTIYAPGKTSVTLDGDPLIPLSKINDLRRRAVEALDIKNGSPLIPRTVIAESDPSSFVVLPEKREKEYRTARFVSPSQITRSATEYFDLLYLPLFSYDPLGGKVKGVILPPVVYDSDRDEVKTALDRAITLGATDVLCTNLGQLPLIRELTTAHPESDIRITGDFRLGVLNGESLAFLHRAGLSSAILSPELTLPQARDIAKKGDGAVIVYGRIPLMLLEKCVNIGNGGQKKGSPCLSCKENCEKHPENAYIPSARLSDRKKAVFPVLREWKHRNVVYNSLPTYLADRKDTLRTARILHHHFIFSCETPKEIDDVVLSYRQGLSPKQPVRRLPG